MQNNTTTKPMESKIKVCVDPGCEAVYHNCHTKPSYCFDCGGRIMEINQDTYTKKFSNNWFQYDYETKEYYKPIIPQLKLDL